MEQVDLPTLDNHFVYVQHNYLNFYTFWDSLSWNSLVEASSTMPVVTPRQILHGIFGCSTKDGWGPLSSEHGDLAPCFFQGILFGLSSILMILAGSYQIYNLRNKKASVSNKVTWSFYLKLILVLVYFGFQSASVLAYGGHDIISSALSLNILASVVAFGLHYIEQFRAFIPSGVLLSYWLFQVVLNIGRIVNLKLRESANSNFFALTVLSIINAFLILSLEAGTPITPLALLSNETKRSPYDSANLFSRLTFNWMSGLMKKGYAHYLTENDLPPLPVYLRSRNTSEKFYHNWNSQSGKKSLFKALAKSFGIPFLVGGCFKAMQDTLAFIQPQLLRLLIKFVNEYSESLKTGNPIPLTRGFMIAGCMFVVSVTQTAFVHQYFHRVFDLGMKIKTALISVIYNKALVLSNDTRNESTTGDIVNLMSVDVQRLQELVQNVQLIWSGPFQITICLISLHNLLGKSMWAGLAVMIITIPLNAVLARYQKKLQKTQMKNKDERSRLISEILNNIKSLKLYGWEKPYLNKLNSVRNDKELRNLKRMGVFSAFSSFTWNFAPFLVSCSTFMVFTFFEKGKTLLTDIVFPALSLFNLLSFPLATVPMVITNIVEAQVAFSRLTKFLTSSELQTDAVLRLPRVNKAGEVAVSISKGVFLWSKKKGDENYKVALSNINFTSKKGDLDCIVGRVGSGKSSILQAVLGDLYRLEGKVEVHGKIAYASQVPWIMNGTVRDNILFGHKYDPELYNTILKACALTVDLSILPKGDKTEVGEKGISLSGGQKARLSLARAVYARADIYLLDDPLSAVDEHVGKHLIDHVLGPKGLLSTKCKILATNNIGVLSIANHIHMLSDGKLVEQGTYDDIMNNKSSQIRLLITSFGKKKEQSEETSFGEEEGIDNIDYSKLDSDSDLEVKSLRRASLVTLGSEIYDSGSDSVDNDDEDKKARREHTEQGKVKWDVYLQYAKACNPISVAIFLSCTVLSMAVSVSSNVWLKHWSEVNTSIGYNPDVPFYLGIYFLLGMGSSALSLVQVCIMWIFCTIQGSKRLHNSMATSVLRAPMSFFETTPIGRILNRFSNDIYKVDEILGRVFAMFFGNTTRVLFTIFVICFSTWQFIFIIIPLGVLYVYYQRYYLRTSRELRRLDSISRSPIFANFQESLNGVSVIRAYDQVDRFEFMNSERVDKNMSAFHPSVNANRWLAVRLEFLGSIIILAASGLSIFTLKSSYISAGLVGLSVSYSLQVTQSLNWIVRMTVEVETNIVSVERILEYSRLTPEAPEIIETNRPPLKWPAEGEIKFDHYYTKYRPELDYVLKDINLKIDPREKIGIVGRTGAGKSSLTLALFRIIESTKGHIEIDDLNTSLIGLADLRHKLSIIPQDSQVFQGTIRSNLDPTDSFTDDQIWRALGLSHLKDHVLKMFEEKDSDLEISSPLDVPVSEGGSNLSVGQRQLICLARALLVPSHILVLDEATAAVDVETDNILQKTIRAEFKDRTIMTIAHRLNTILDSDRIIVLEKGQIKEFDTPAELLKRQDSLFYSLCKQGGIVS